MSYKEIEENDFDLNIPRYVDTFEKKELPPINEIMKEIRDAHHKSIRLEDDLLAMMEELTGTTEDANEQLKQMLGDFRYYIEERKKHESWCLKEPEIHVGNPICRRVVDIAEVERATKGKIYSAGSTLIPVSAVNESDVPIYLEQDGEVDSRYAVITFLIPCIPYCMWQMVCGVFPKFVHQYATGLNLQADALKFIKIPVYTLNEQMEIANAFSRQDDLIKSEEIMIGKWEAFKKTMMEAMFVDIDRKITLKTL